MANLLYIHKLIAKVTNNKIDGIVWDGENFRIDITPGQTLTNDERSKAENILADALINPELYDKPTDPDFKGILRSVELNQDYINWVSSLPITLALTLTIAINDNNGERIQDLYNKAPTPMTSELINILNSRLTDYGITEFNF